MIELTQEQKMLQVLKRFGVDNWDGIADLLEEAAQEIENLEHQLTVTEGKVKYWQDLAVANRSVAEAAQVRAEIALKEVTRLQEVMQYCCRDKSGEEID